MDNEIVFDSLNLAKTDIGLLDNRFMR